MFRRIITAMASVAACVLALAGSARAAETPYGASFYPNVPLVTQDGREVRFYDDVLKDRRILLNFMFTSCDQVCPLDTAKLVQVEKLLGEQAGRDVHIVSITLDPEHDTPQALKEYARRFGAHWTFLTGTRESIDALRDKLGERSGKENHANSVRIGHIARGYWVRVPLAADAHYILSEAKNLFDYNWSIGKTLPSIAEAPRPEVFGPGQLVFNNKCAACHAFGQGDKLGPDLQGVTSRRDASWLARFIAAPDRVRLSGDPVARELASRYAVRMPTLGLTRKEVGDLLDYLQAKAAPPAAATEATAGHAAHDHAAHGHAAHDHSHHPHPAPTAVEAAAR